MASNYFKIKNGANLAPAASSVAIKGDLAYNSSSDKLEYYNGVVDSLVSEAKAATLTNKTISGSSNTLSNIAYSALVLTGSIVNADISSSAAIAYSKLALTGSVVNADISASAAIAYSKLALTGSIVNADISSSAAIAYTKLSLTSSIVNADISSSAAIAYSKLSLSGAIQNSDLAGSIAASKLVGTDIATVGTITTGTWSATAIAANKGGTGQTTYTKGDILVASNSTTLTKVGVGTDGQIPVADSTQATGIKWATLQQGAKNYITYNNFENNATTGWSLGTVGSLTNGLPTGTPTFGSGAAGTLSIATVSTGQLGGSYSLSLASSAATTSGNMLASQAYTIDVEDQAKVLAWKFYYQAQSGASNCNFSGTSSNSFAVAIWDVTNSTWLSSAGNFNLIQSSGVGICQGTFQTGATTSQIRLVLYFPNATAGAATLYLDDFYVGPQSLAFGPPMSPLTAYTPTRTNLTIGNGTEQCSWAREGQFMVIEYSLTFGSTTSASGTIEIGIPSFAVIDSNIIALGIPQASGSAIADHSAVSKSSGTVFTLNSNTLVIGGPTGGYWNASVPFTWTTGDTLSFQARVPIVGWPSNTVMSADSDTRVIACRYTVSGGTVNNTRPVIAFNTIDYDTSGAYNTGTGVWTCPVSGKYQFNVGALLTGTTLTTTQDFEVQLNKNGSLFCELGRTYGNGSSNSYGVHGQAELNLVAGDQITITVFSAASTTLITGSNYNYFEATKVSGPAVVAASESVNARYTNATTSVPNTSTTVVNYSTKVYDSHNAYNTSTGLYTVPVSGKYRVTVTFQTSASVAGTVGGEIDAIIQHNGSTYSANKVFCQTTSSIFYACQNSDTVSCLAGDTIGAACLQSLSASSISIANQSTGPVFIAIERVGN